MFISKINSNTTFPLSFKKKENSNTGTSLKYILPLAAALASQPVETSALRDGDFADTFSKRSYEKFQQQKNSNSTQNKLLREMGINLSADLIEKIMKEKTVTLDAGHGGQKPQANYSHNGTKYIDKKTKKIYYEKTVNLAITKKVREYLKMLGTNVVMTRENDDYVWYDDRARLAKNKESDVFVSIHANSCVDRRVKGASVYCYEPTKAENSTPPKINTPKDNNLLAQKIYGCVKDVYDYKSLGLFGGDFRVLREINVKHSKKTKIPAAVLVEAGFMSNPEEAKLLIDAKHQDKLAKEIAKGIILYSLEKIPEDLKKEVIAQEAKSNSTFIANETDFKLTK